MANKVKKRLRNNEDEDSAEEESLEKQDVKQLQRRWKRRPRLVAGENHERVLERRTSGRPTRKCSKSSTTLENKKPKTALRTLREAQGTVPPHSSSWPTLPSMPIEVLEHIAGFLDTCSVLTMLGVCKDIKYKLEAAPHLWKDICNSENLGEYSLLKDDDSSVVSYNGEQMHLEEMPTYAGFWRKVYLRGLQMRRNLCKGRFRLWRLFLTGDEEHMPVAQMTSSTTPRELRQAHRRSVYRQRALAPLNRHRRVRTLRYWNEDYLVVLQHHMHNNVSDVFVWQWKECHDPKFLYVHNMSSVYPSGLFPTAFFLYKQYLVMMPDVGFSLQEQRSLIRVHDLSRQMELVGSYDFPKTSGRLRHRNRHEPAHLHRVGDCAVALCRTPELRVFVFSIPDCALLAEVTPPADLERPLEDDELDQRFFMYDNTMMFVFLHPDFFNHLLDVPFVGGVESLYGRMLIVNFDQFVSKRGPISARVVSEFDRNTNHVEKISLLSSKRIVCYLSSGSLEIRDIINESATKALTLTRLTIPSPEAIRDDSLDTSDSETDGPSLCTSRDGHIIVTMRHYRTGRKMHAYSDKGQLMYSINMDDPAFQLTPLSGYTFVDMDENFLCAADLDNIAVWNSKTGAFIRTIELPKHYSTRTDPSENEPYCWRGHIDFAFAEDGIIIIHTQRNFPAAADILLFW